MEEQEFTEQVMEAVMERSDEWDEGVSVRSFEDAGVMTMNQGFVARMADGSEFQVTVVQSRSAS